MKQKVKFDLFGISDIFDSDQNGGCVRYEADKTIPKEDRELHGKIFEAVMELPDEIDLGVDEKGEKIILSCHILARAVAMIFGVKYVDGKYLNFYEHAWVETRSGRIIDLYPVAAISPPIIIDANVSPGIFRKRAYITLSKRNWKNRFGEMDNSPSFHKAVDIVAELLQKNLSL